MIAYVDAPVLLRLAIGQPNLATALLWKDMTGIELTVATHALAVGLCAKAHGMPVVGVA